jgi:uncharacterized oxidoreductase
MNISGNTILITGGGSGIGRALAESFHKLDNQVVIAGRRQATLDAVTAANPGMRSLALDIDSADGIATFAARAVQAFPALNVVINNAGIMRPENLVAAPDYLPDAEATITTNLLGPIRLTAALLPHLRTQPHSAVIMVSSGLAFVPLALTPTYSATKAAIHSYTVSLRHQLRGAVPEVIEIIPPYVQTHLMGEHQASDPAAMPLEAFIAEVMEIFHQRPTPPEVVVERCGVLRFAAEHGAVEQVFHTLNP